MSTNTEANNTEQSHLHCPYCDRKFFTAATVVDMNFKCDKCHRRYLINLNESSINIKLIGKPDKD